MILLFSCATKLPNVPEEDFEDLGVFRQTHSARHILTNVWPKDPELTQYRYQAGVYEIQCEEGERYEIKFKSASAPGVFTVYLVASN